MGKPYKLRGDFDQKFKQLETTIKQLLGRSRKTTTFATPPVPLSFYSGAMLVGDSFNYLNTLSGKVKKFYFYYDKIKDVDEVMFTFDFVGPLNKVTYGFITSPGKLTTISKEVVVAAGDRITIGHEHDGEVNNLWVGFPVFPEKGHFDYTRLSIDTLLEEESNEGI